jgi:transketolase
MSLAPAAYLLYQRLMRHDPADPQWAGRDRFVLSCGHSSLTQYIQLYLAGYGLELTDLEALRTWGSLTPGHPEAYHTPGIEITTGPLGSGMASAVGMAYAARRERGLLDPEAEAGQSVFDHTIWVLASDGDIEEGVTSEASQLAGLQQLGNLVVIYDQNRISIEDDTAIALDEDTAARYAAYGWHVQTVDWTAGVGPDAGRRGTYHEDVPALQAALLAAQAETTRPSLIVLTTVIAWPAPTMMNTGASHGAALGAAEVAATKRVMGLDPEASFAVADDVLAHARRVRDRGAAEHARWDQRLEAWRAAAGPERVALFERMRERRLHDGWQAELPTFEAGTDVATRKASGVVLNAIKDALPELWGGSADLAESNNTALAGESSFLPSSISTRLWGQGDPYGRVLHFGIREHAMGMIMNGIALHGGTRVFGGTFLVFSDYMRPAVRLAALMQLPVTYVWTHDSIGLGEDGPTHQPVEHLAALRAIPGLDVVRPADANETAWAWRTVLEQTDRPAALCLSRQNLPTVDRTTGEFADASGVARGGYVLQEATGGDPQVILIATGSEVQLAVAARTRLQQDGIATRVVSLPCREWFEAQDGDYRDSVLPRAVRARVSVEAAVGLGWRDLVGDAGRVISLERFGASAGGPRLFEEFGITTDAVVAAARDSLADSAGQTR